MKNMKTKSVLLSLFFLLFLLLFIFSGDEVINVKEYREVLEPEAPLAENVVVTSHKDIPPVSYSIVNSDFASESGNYKIITSESGKYVLSLVNLNNSIDVNSPVVEDNYFSLSLFSSKGELVNQIEDSKVSGAKLVNDSTVIYHTLKEDYGIFSFNIKTKAKTKVIETSDPEFLNYIDLLSDTKIFWIEPKTGKFGTTDIETLETVTLGQEANSLNSLEDNNMASFSSPVVSYDKSKIALVKNSGETFTREFLVLDTQKIDFNNPIAAFTSEELLQHENRIKWSKDSKLINTGTDGTIFSVTTGKKVFSLQNSRNSTIIFSPYNNSFIGCETEKSKKCTVYQVEKFKKVIELPENIDQVSWANKDNIVFDVGKSLYTMNIQDKKLKKVTETRGNFNLPMDSSLPDGLIVENQNQFFTINIINSNEQNN